MVMANVVVMGTILPPPARGMGGSGEGGSGLIEEGRGISGSGFGDGGFGCID